MVTAAAPSTEQVSVDAETFAALYEQYGTPVHDFVRRVVRNEEDAADITQEVFTRAYAKWEGLRDERQVKSWLFSIAHHAALDHLRRARHTVNYTGEAEDEEQADPLLSVADADREVNPEEVLAQQQTRAAVWTVAQGLPERQYALLDLHVRRGLDADEIAAILGTTRNNVYVMLNRTKREFEQAAYTYILMRHGREDCAVLRGMVDAAGAEGLTRELRFRIDRHINRCETCGERRRRIVAPLELLGAMAAFAPPPDLFERIQQGAGIARASGEVGGASPGTGGAHSFGGLPVKLIGLMTGAVLVISGALFGINRADTADGGPEPRAQLVERTPEPAVFAGVGSVAARPGSTPAAVVVAEVMAEEPEAEAEAPVEDQEGAPASSETTLRPAAGLATPRPTATPARNGSTPAPVGGMAAMPPSAAPLPALTPAPAPERPAPSTAAPVPPPAPTTAPAPAVVNTPEPVVTPTPVPATPLPATPPPPTPAPATPEPVATPGPMVTPAPDPVTPGTPPDLRPGQLPRPVVTPAPPTPRPRPPTPVPATPTPRPKPPTPTPTPTPTPGGTIPQTHIPSVAWPVATPWPAVVPVPPNVLNQTAGAAAPR